MQCESVQAVVGPVSQPSLHNCEICGSTNDEIVCMLSALLESLRGLGEVAPGRGDGYGGLPKLLELMFYSKCKNWRDTMKCSHDWCQK